MPTPLNEQLDRISDGIEAARACVANLREYEGTNARHVKLQESQSLAANLGVALSYAEDICHRYREPAQKGGR